MKTGRSFLYAHQFIFRLPINSRILSTPSQTKIGKRRTKIGSPRLSSDAYLFSFALYRAKVHVYLIWFDAYLFSSDKERTKVDVYLICSDAIGKRVLNAVGQAHDRAQTPSTREPLPNGPQNQAFACLNPSKKHLNRRRLSQFLRRTTYFFA